MSDRSIESNVWDTGSQFDTETLLRNIGRFPSQVLPVAILRELQSRGSAIHDSVVASIRDALQGNESPIGGLSNTAFFAFALLPPIVMKEDQPLIEKLIRASLKRVDEVIGDLFGEAMSRLIANFFQSQSADEVFVWIDRLVSEQDLEELNCQPLLRAVTIANAMSWLDRTEAVHFLVEQLKKRTDKKDDTVSAFVVSELFDMSARDLEEVDSIVRSSFARHQIDESFINLEFWDNKDVLDGFSSKESSWEDCADELENWYYDFVSDDFDPVNATYLPNPRSSSNSKISESEARNFVEQLRTASRSSYPREAIATLDREFPVAYQAIIDLLRQELSQTHLASDRECGRGVYLGLVLLVSHSMPLPQDLLHAFLSFPDSRLKDIIGQQFGLVVKCIAQSPIQDVGIIERWIWDPARCDANRREMVGYYSNACFRNALDREVAIEALAKGLRRALTETPSLVAPFAENLALLSPTEHALLLEEAFEGVDVEWRIAKDDLRHMMNDVRIAKEIFEDYFQIRQSILEIVSFEGMFDISAIDGTTPALPISHRTGQSPSGLEATPPSFSVTGTIRNEERTSRNSPCPCGSGKKFKKCCMRK